VVDCEILTYRRKKSLNVYREVVFQALEGLYATLGLLENTKDSLETLVGQTNNIFHINIQGDSELVLTYLTCLAEYSAEDENELRNSAGY
jgi:hypothetical protein